MFSRNVQSDNGAAHQNACFPHRQSADHLLFIGQGQSALGNVAAAYLDECDPLHAPVVWLLHELNTLLLEPCTGGIHIRHIEANVTVALVVLVIVPIVVVRILGIILTSPVVRQLQAAWPAEDPLNLQELILRM